MSGYILDFYCAELKLAIEVDGAHHDPDHDGIRSLELQRDEIEVVRIPNEMLIQHYEIAVDIIQAAVDRRMFRNVIPQPGKRSRKR